MEKTPTGTSVGVDDPYAHVDRCDFVTDDGRCRFAFDHPEVDPEFARARRAEEFRCPVVTDADGDWTWADCPHFRARSRGHECARCGLGERRMAHSRERPLLEEHHLSYADGESGSESDEAGEGDGSADGATGDGAPAHEITVTLCRWCHAKVHGSWARIDDDAEPDPEAVAAREGRRSREQDELGFESAAEAYDPGGADGDAGAGNTGEVTTAERNTGEGNTGEEYTGEETAGDTGTAGDRGGRRDR